MSGQVLGWTFLFAAIIATALAQFALKRAAGNVGDHLPVIASLQAMMLRWPWLASSLALFVASFGMLTVALRSLPLSLAYPLQSLELVAMAVISHALLGETLGPRRWMAILLIVLGTICVGI